MFWKLWFIYIFTICSLSISKQKWQYCLGFIIIKYLQSQIKVALQASRHLTKAFKSIKLKEKKSKNHSQNFKTKGFRLSKKMSAFSLSI